MTTPLRSLRSFYNTHLNLHPDDRWVVDSILATLVATFHPSLQTESIWLRIVGPPSCGKTECIRPLSKHERCIFVSSMTDNSLISGFRDDDDVDPSLILKLNHKVLIIKDLTDLLCHHKQTTQKLFGDLRDAYDGECSKASGHSGLTSYESRFGIILCVTDVVDTFPEFTQQLGERFVTLRMSRLPKTPEQSLQFLGLVASASTSKLIWEAALREKMESTLKALQPLYATMPLPTIPPAHMRQVQALSYLLAQLRTTPINGITVDAEVGCRVQNQLLNIGLARAISDLRTTWDDSDTLFARRIIFDSMSRDRRKFVATLATTRHPSLPITVQQLCSATHRPAKDVEELVNQFIHINVLRRVTKTSFILTEKTRSLLDETKLFHSDYEHSPLYYVSRKEEAEPAQGIAK